MIEICYDSLRTMLCPSMYAAMAANLGLPYFVTTGAGGYGTPMLADVPQLQLAFTQALRTAFGRGRRPNARPHCRIAAGY